MLSYTMEQKNPVRPTLHAKDNINRVVCLDKTQVVCLDKNHNTNNISPTLLAWTCAVGLIVFSDGRTKETPYTCNLMRDGRSSWTHLAPLHENKRNDLINPAPQAEVNQVGSILLT